MSFLGLRCFTSFSAAPCGQALLVRGTQQINPLALLMRDLRAVRKGIVEIDQTGRTSGMPRTRAQLVLHFPQVVCKHRERIREIPVPYCAATIRLHGVPQVQEDGRPNAFIAIPSFLPAIVPGCLAAGRWNAAFLRVVNLPEYARPEVEPVVDKPAASVYDVSYTPKSV